MYWICLIAAIGSRLQWTGFGVKKKKKNITSPSSLSLQYASHHTEYAPPSPVYGTTLFGMLERHSILRWLPKMAQWSSFVYS